MPYCDTCTVCDKPGTLQSSNEKAPIPCDVRHFRNERFTVWRCPNCNSLHSADDVDLQRYYSHFPLKQHTLDFPTRAIYSKRVRLLEKNGVLPSDRILDYGCGSGAFVKLLKEKDFSHARGYDAFVPEYADRQVLSETQDAVVSFDVIEHADDPHQFLAGLRDLLRPGGLMIIGTPNADYLSVAGKTPPEVELSQPYHRHILSERVLLDLGRKVGLDVVQVFRRNPTDTFIPGINMRFMWNYKNHMGGFLDATVEPVHVTTILSSPTLLFSAFFGALYPPRGNMMVIFRREELATK
jgi:SAM-dependent methyltransferase